MADKKEYIERGAFLRKCAEAWGHYGVTIKAIEGIADECKAADVVAVVRCKDCKYWGGVTFGYICRGWSGMTFRNYTKPDHYCSRGERKEQT